MNVEQTFLPVSSETEQAAPHQAKPVAVIDIGTTLIRMAIAQIDERGEIQVLDRLSQTVDLGKETFNTRMLDKETIEQCVNILRSYRKVLREYQIDNPEQIRVVATSAVREADNRLAFADRIYSATGIEVRAIDESEVNRLTYLGIQPFLDSELLHEASKTIVAEIGGGNTELLVIQGRDVLHSQTHRLGSIRLRAMLSEYLPSSEQYRQMMENQIKLTVSQIAHQIPRGPEDRIELVTLGSDVRFAAAQLLPEEKLGQLVRVPLKDLEKFTGKILDLSEDRLVQKYHLTFSDAETVGPALLAYVQLAKAFSLEHILVASVNLRDGLLYEMAQQGAWSEESWNQIVRSAVDLGRRLGFDEKHAEHVAHLSQLLFQALQEEHSLDTQYERILYLAAVLHEIGLFINYRGYHKHTQYLISNSELFGLGEREVLLISLVARYHRRASPKPTHVGYTSLDRENRLAVAKLAAILRIADALDRSRSQRIRGIHCECTPGQLVISIPNVDDLSLERLAIKQSGTLFDEVYGMKVLLRTVRT